MDKVKLFRILSIIFAILTFVGAGIVLFKKGDISPGVAVFPSVTSVIFSNLCLQEKNKKNDK